MTCVFCEGAGMHGVLENRLGGARWVAAWSTPTCSAPWASIPRSSPVFAFGFGIDRLVQLLYGVDHIKNLGTATFVSPPVLRPGIMRAPLAWIATSHPSRRTSPTSPTQLNQLGLRGRGDRRTRPRDRRCSGRSHPRCDAASPDADRIRWPTSTRATVRCGWCAARPTSKRACWCRSRRVGAQLPGRFQDRPAQDPRPGLRGDALLGARARPRRRPRRHSRVAGRRAVWAPTCAKCSVSDDVVFDLAITPNRPDAMGIIGVAR